MKKYIALFLSLALLFGTLALPAEAATDSFTKKTPSVTVKATSYNSAKVSFKKVSGAKGYIIYRKTSKSGKSKKLATVKSLSYVNKSLNCGSTYYYRVRAYKKTCKKLSTQNIPPGKVSNSPFRPRRSLGLLQAETNSPSALKRCPARRAIAFISPQKAARKSFIIRAAPPKKT